MHFILLLILLYHATLALIYNDTCTKNCYFPGLICLNNRCICDSTARLFWTNARCAPCPNDWTMTETACLAYYETPMTWETAKATCWNMQAELISFRQRDLIALISTTTNKFSAWTSAHRSELGIYQWLDATVPSFDEESDWWCRNTTADLGYTYQYNEPTRYTNQKNETEECVVYWRGMTSTEVICLDDQYCSREFAFVCEKTESTANQHLGPPPPVQTDLVNASADVRISVVHEIPENVGTVIINANFRKPVPQTQSTSSTGVILLIVSAVLLLALIGGLLYYFKYRNPSKTQSDTDNTAKKNTRKPVASAVDTSLNDESGQSETSASEVSLSNSAPVNPTFEMTNEQSQKGKRSGYSKQTFDEFE